MSDYKIGQLIELNDGREATVRYVGTISAADGLFVGVEFAEAQGKNDGSVRGERYFECDPNHGMFLRPSGISKVLKQPKAAPKVNGRPTSQAPKARPSSLVVSPTGSSSPTKRPLSTITSRTSRPSMAPPARRMSTAPTAPPAPPRATVRQSVVGPLLGSNRISTTISAGKAPVGRPSLAPTKRPSPTSSTVKKLSPPSATSTSTATTRISVTHDKQLEESEMKLRILEKKRLEDREKLKELDRVQQERDKFESIIQKLQAKYQPIQQENNELKKRLREAESTADRIEILQEEHDTQIEMATLDREMAEEKADAAMSENLALKQRVEELELENEILKDENEELGEDMSPEERTTTGWLQMERENERLREALIRLRDISQDQEAELKTQIKGLEEEVQDRAKFKQQYDDTKAKLLETEADIEDLRQQLDAALGAEEMIEELSDQNMSLKEKIDGLYVVIDDLQSIKELNDELEINHIENEKELHEQLEFKEAQILEQSRRSAQQQEMLDDQGYTILRFRELVTNLQSDLEDMRSTKEITETEAQELANRSKQMMDLNRQLQVSASNTKVKTIEMELRKLDAQEAAEHLAIVQLFLPEAFHTERDSVLALLRFKRIAFKAHLLHGFVKDRVSGSDRHIHDDDVFDACDVMDKLTWIEAMCERFINSISGCSLDQFATFEGALYELEPVERALNGYIDGLKRDELREKQVADELHRSIAVMSHLETIYLPETLEAYADDVIMRTLLIQSHLETTAVALAIIKSEVQSHIPVPFEEEEDDDVAPFIQKTEAMIVATRSAKVVVGKTVRALQELKSRSLSLAIETSDSFEECLEGTKILTTYTRKLGENLFMILKEEGRSSAPTISEIRSAASNTTATYFSDIHKDSDFFSVITTRLRVLSDALAELNSLSTNLSRTIEFERTTPPWILRSKELAASKIISVDAEEEVRRLKDEVYARATAIKLRDKDIEEKAVKIELLEARTRDATKKTAKIKELESRIDELRTRERALLDDNEKRARDVRRLEEERERWAAQAALQAKLHDRAPGGQRDQGADKVATKKDVEKFGKDLDYLERANRWLRAMAKKESRNEKKKAMEPWIAVPLTPDSSHMYRYAAKYQSLGSRKVEDVGYLARRNQVVDMSPCARRKWTPKQETPNGVVEDLDAHWGAIWTPFDKNTVAEMLEEVNVQRNENWTPWSKGSSLGLKLLKESRAAVV